MSEVDQIISEINQMRVQWFNEVEAGARRTWPKSIRERVVRLGLMKINAKEVAQLTQVPYETVIQWRHYQKKLERRFHALEVRKSDATVTVALPESGDRNLIVTVTTPKGYKIEGVTSEVIRVVKELGRV